MSDMTRDTDEQPLFADLAAGLQSITPPAARAQTLRAALSQRVRASVDAHREYTTIREGDGGWEALNAGVQRRLLRSETHTRVEIQRLAAGAVLAWPEGVAAQELLLLEGSLSSSEGLVTTAGLPGARGYCVRHRSTAPQELVADTQATVYVRHLLSDACALPPLEAHWWDMAAAKPGWVDPGSKRWRASSPGVEVLPLRGDAGVLSMLVRFAPGASVPDHAHALDEDCLVLQGEMFLGDILLTPGDYQMAPAGCTHFGTTSDVGVLFFLHGALDPVLKGEPRAPA